MNILLLALPIIIIIIISAALMNLIKYKIEQAHFITVCMISLVLILFGIIGIMQIAYYIILLIAFTSLIYLIIVKIGIKRIITPGIFGYLIGLAIFIFLSRGCGLFDHDDIVHWSYATKYMYFSDSFYKGLQAMFTPTFNYFITKTSLNFTESSLFVGAWIIIWSCFILPLANLQWKDWKRVALFMFMQYCLMGFIYGNVSLHIDQSMGYMGGALAAFAVINKKKTIKDYILIIIGLLAISQMKDSFGAVTSMLTAIFIIVAEIIQNFNKLKHSISRIILLFLTPIVGYFISALTISKPAGYLSTENIYKLPLFNLIIQSKLTLFILALFLVSLIFFIIYLVKNELCIKIGKYNIHLYKIAGIITFIIIGVLFYKLSSLFFSTFSFTDRTNFMNAWRDFFYHTYSGLTNKYLLGIIGIVVGFAGVYSIKKEYRKAHSIQFITMFILVLIYVMLVLIAFSAGFHRSGQYAASISWERYLSTALILLITYVIMYFVLAPDIYEDEKKHRIIFIFLVLAIVIRYVPYPGIIWNSRAEPERFGPSSFITKYQEHSDIISNNVDKNDSVFVVTHKIDDNSEDKSFGYYPNIYIKYTVAPILTNWIYAGYSTDEGNLGTYMDYINEIKNYDYIYIQSAGMKYYERFKDLYQEDSYYSSKALYKINLENDEVILKLIIGDGDIITKK